MRLKGAPIGGIDSTAVIGRPAQHRDYRAARVPVRLQPQIARTALVEKLVQVDAGTERPTQVRPHAWVMAGSHIAHDCIVGERSELAAGVILCGHVEIGNDVRVGVGAMFRSFVKVGQCARIGMGAVVTRDVKPYECVAGNPARTLYMLCPHCGRQEHTGRCEEGEG